MFPEPAQIIQKNLQGVTYLEKTCANINPATFSKQQRGPCHEGH